MTDGRRNLRGKLDTTTMLDTTAVAADTVVVNGPEDEPLGEFRQSKHSTR